MASRCGRCSVRRQRDGWVAWRRLAVAAQREECADGVEFLRPLPARPGAANLDFIRGNLFDPRLMRPLPPDVVGPDNDLADLLDHYTERAIADDDAVVHVCRRGGAIRVRQGRSVSSRVERCTRSTTGWADHARWSSPDSRIVFSRRRSLRLARRIAIAMNGATNMENPAGSPRLCSVIRVAPSLAEDQV